MHPTCVCCEQLITNNYKDIFDKNLIIVLPENDTNTESDKHIILKDAIQLIIGCKVSKTDNANLCIICFQMIESYIRFRFRLTGSLGRLNCTQLSVANSASTSETMENLETLCDIKVSNIDATTSTEEIECINVNNSLPNFSHTDLDDILNTSKVSSYDSRCSNNLNDFGSSDDNSNISVTQEHVLKVQENDLESEIDVCSGEDDEVLELDIQCRPNETVDISSSSESDIEVCDYEPSDKRMKHHVALSPTVLF